MNNKYTNAELVEMWKRTPQEQYDVMVAKIIEAINLSNGKIFISWSGGADSTFLLYVFCSVWKDLYPNRFVKVGFADTTNEHRWTYKFIKEFPEYIYENLGVKLEFYKTRPQYFQTYASICKDIGLPLISKQVSSSIEFIKKQLKQLDLKYEDIEPYLDPTVENKNKLEDMGFSKSCLTYLLGYNNKLDTFSDSSLRLAKRWRPLIYAPFNVSAKCCNILKKNPLNQLTNKIFDEYSFMTGEMACESDIRRKQYLKTGCNNFDNGKGVSKPMGSMSQQGVLANIYKLQMPVCECYGHLEYVNGEYKYSGRQRTGCSLCGFGIIYEPDRFIRLQETEPSKVKLAFTSIEDSGLGYKEAIEYLNKYCKCNIQIPEID